MEQKVLLFDLDGTLLQSNKTISNRTLDILQACRNQGILIGISTSRSEVNSLAFLSTLNPDILIASGGAVVKFQCNYLYTVEFTSEETQHMIALSREICGTDCEITIDTLTHHFWNYKIDPIKNDASWGESIYTDYQDFNGKALKMCVEIVCSETAADLSEQLPECDCIKFSDSEWYKFTRKGVTKENAIQILCEKCNISIDNIIAFGDDLADIGMLQLCGTGVAMGNALDAVKAAADIVIGDNDNDGIANFWEIQFLQAPTAAECY